MPTEYGTTTNGDISRSTNVYLQPDFLKAGEPHLLTELFGESSNVPKGKGVVSNWVEYLPYDPTPNILQEGITPTPKKMQRRVVQASLVQLGDTTELTDVVADTNEDPVLQTQTELMGRQAGEMIELHRLGILKAGTSVAYANGLARNAVNTPLTKNTIYQIVRALERARASKITRVIKSTAAYGTRSVQPSFIALAHPDLRKDIEGMQGFIPMQDYGALSPYDSEIGTVGLVRFLADVLLTPFADAGGAKSGSGTEMLSTSGVSADVYPVLIFGERAYGIVAHKLYKAKVAQGSQVNSWPVEIYVQNPDKSTKDDILAQRGGCGWKTYSAAAILTDAWLWRAEVACTL